MSSANHISAKNAILAKLRDAKARAIPKETLGYPVWQSHDNELIKQRFIAGLLASHAEVSCVNASEIPKTLARVLNSKGCEKVIVGDANAEQGSGEFFPAILEGAHRIEVTQFDCEFEALKTSLFTEFDAGITHCLGGIADTGTLVLWPDIAEPRTLSLIPPCHIALIKRSTIVSNFAQMMTLQAWQEKMPTNIVLVSGPSKTADIQQTLAYGAHGPSQLVVILVEDR
ncbi:LutC/YkgG family protein [Shewanella nanhaiensis]|uniref:Lactate utilization protein C n=1 Tax=Shewanella nanhaiensis TaxID=2864872 RepID=A0ABS7DZV1_9GAMM|nr:lactate utilization protein C [Shewanella nanhaiensis]MBW8182975.1 lactate utilization protein C [Shewanella nanhaiensis]